MSVAINSATNSATVSLSIPRGSCSLNQRQVTCFFDPEVDPVGQLTCFAPQTFAGLTVGTEALGTSIDPGSVISTTSSIHVINLSKATLAASTDVTGDVITFDTVRGVITLDWISASFTQNGATAAKECVITISVLTTQLDALTDFKIMGKTLSSAVNKKDGLYTRFPGGLKVAGYGSPSVATITATLDRATNGVFYLAAGYSVI